MLGPDPSPAGQNVFVGTILLIGGNGQIIASLSSAGLQFGNGTDVAPIAWRGEWDFGGAAGTPGQVLVTNGPGLTPNWGSTATLADSVNNAGTVSTGVVAANAFNSNVTEVTLAGFITINITNIALTQNTAQNCMLVLIQDATGSRPLPTIWLNGSVATVKWDNGITPVLTTTPGKTDIIQITAVNIAGVITLYGAQVIGAA